MAIPDREYDHTNFENNNYIANVLKEYKIISQEGFCNSSQCLLTIDKNGFTFNYQCRQLLDKTKYIQLAYHPVKQKIIVLPAKESDICSISWLKRSEKDSRMHRISFKSLTMAIYENMNWNLDMNYRFSGHMVNISGNSGIEFQLSKGIIILCKRYFDKIVKPEKKIDVTKSVEHEHADNLNIEQIKNLANPSKTYELDIFSDTGRGKRSHAIYFETTAETISLDDNDIITIDKIGKWIKSGNHEKLNTISMVYEVKKIQNNRYTINESDIFESDLMIHRSGEKSASAKQVLQFQECGWTSEIKLLDKAIINKLICEIENECGRTS